MTPLGIRPRMVVLTILAVVASAGATTHAQSPTDRPAMSDTAAGVTDTLPLEGTTWRLVELRVGDEARTAGPEVAAWVTLRAGRVRGSGGCNRIAGQYARMGPAIAIELEEVGAGSCAERTMLVERGLVEGLERAVEAEVMASDDPLAGQLVVRDASRSERLRFALDDAADLDIGEWQLVAYGRAGGMVEAQADAMAVLALRAGRDREVRRRSSGDLVGSSGCNGLVGQYQREASVLQVRSLDRTDAPCSAELQAQEAAMLAVLGSTMAVELPPDRLILTSTDSGERLELVASAPLVGSTWLVARIPGAQPSGADVTLRLEDGVLVGEGPCGPYGGRYETNGIFIAFSDVAGSGDRECPRRATERRLLAALRRAVLVDRSTPRIRLLDARGRTVLRLRQPAGP